MYCYCKIWHICFINCDLTCHVMSKFTLIILYDYIKEYAILVIRVIICQRNVLSITECITGDLMVCWNLSHNSCVIDTTKTFKSATIKPVMLVFSQLQIVDSWTKEEEDAILIAYMYWLPFEIQNQQLLYRCTGINNQTYIVCSIPQKQNSVRWNYKVYLFLALFQKCLAACSGVSEMLNVMYLFKNWFLWTCMCYLLSIYDVHTVHVWCTQCTMYTLYMYIFSCTF